LESAKTAPSAEAYAQVLAWAQESDDGNLNNNACWFATLDGFASAALPACDRAIRLGPGNGGWRDSRGIARAMLGDTVGAVQDFEAFIQWAQAWPAPSRVAKDVPKREAWLSGAPGWSQSVR